MAWSARSPASSGRGQLGRSQPILTRTAVESGLNPARGRGEKLSKRSQPSSVENVPLIRTTHHNPSVTPRLRGTLLTLLNNE